MNNNLTPAEELLALESELQATAQAQEVEELTPYQKHRHAYLESEKLTMIEGGIYQGKSQAPMGVLLARAEQEKAYDAILDIIQDSPVYLTDAPCGDINVDFYYLQKQVAKTVWAEMLRTGKTVADGNVFTMIAAAAVSLGQRFMVPSMEIPSHPVYKTGITSEKALYDYLTELFDAQCEYINAFSVGGQVREQVDVARFQNQPIVTIQNVPEKYLAVITRTFTLATKTLPPERQASSKANGDKQQKRTKK